MFTSDMDTATPLAHREDQAHRAADREPLDGDGTDEGEREEEAAEEEDSVGERLHKH